MNPPRCQDEDYIQSLPATPRTCSATEAARVQPTRPDAPAHDAFTRLLHRLEPDPQSLWQEVRPLVRRRAGVLVFDDTTLDKPHAHHIQLVTRHWSGKHWAVVQGINLITALWTDGDRMYPTDYRPSHKHADGKTKNDHFRDLLATAHERGFEPECILFDSWYCGLEDLKAVRGHGWRSLGRMTGNRRVRLDRGAPRRVDEQPIAATGTVVWLPGFGLVKVFRVVAPDGDTQHWVTNDLGMDELTRLTYAERSWAIEEYHRGVKQHCGAERCQVRLGRAQCNHINLALRAFVRLEWHRYRTGVSWFEAKAQIVRDAVRRYLEAPLYLLPQPSSA